MMKVHTLEKPDLNPINSLGNPTLPVVSNTLKLQQWGQDQVIDIMIRTDRSSRNCMTHLSLICITKKELLSKVSWE